MNHGMNSQWMEMSVASFRRLLAWPFVLLAAAIVALTLGGIAHIAHHQQQKELARLQAIATFKTNQIATWLREREGDAQLLQSSRYVADLYRRWRDTGDLASRELLLQRLDDYRKAYNYQEILLLNDRGEPVLATADTLLHIAPELRTTIQRAVAEGRMLNTGLYRGVDEPPTIHLDFVVPLLALEDHPGVVIVLHVDPRVVLYPLLASWPIPSASGEILLFRRDGDQVLYLSDLRQHPDAAAKLRLPIAESRLLAARVLRGEVALDGVAGEVTGIDYRGAPSLGVVSAIPGTDWFLLAKLDQAEVYAPAWQDAGWIGLLGALALLAAATTQIIAHQRREQSEKLESLQQLANERHRLRTLIQTIPDLIWLKDPDGAYLGCNPRFERFIGAKEADLIGKSDHDFFDPEQADFFRRKDRDALAAGRPNANEEWITFAEDSHRELLQTIKTPMRDVSGNLVGVLGIGRDITALREAEAGKQAVERQYQALFRAMQDGCALHELIFGAGGQPIDYRFLAVNPAFERLIGLKAEHLLGKTVLEVLPCVERYWIDLYGQVVLTGEPALFENYSQDLGRYFKVKAFRPEPGQFACIVTDITERKQAEQALRDSEERYRVLAEYSPDWEYWFGTDGGYRYISPACLGITGYTAAEFMADPGLLERLVHPADRPVYAEHFRSLRANVEWDLVELEFRIRCRDGRERWIGHICSAVVDERGRPLGRRGVNRDITERKQAEQALSVALEEKTSLLKEVHHRVKNNLQIVTSLLNLQARQVQNPAALAALQDTQGRIRSMALLHETLYREGDLGKADGAVYLSHLCAHLHSVFSAVTGQVRLRHQLDPVALTPDQAVPCGLIVNELVSNAFKHAFPGERGGEIQVALTAEPDGHRVLAVTDNGVGLPPGLDIEQSDTLGLQLVAGLAHQLGGAVETRTTAGTMFRIAFPAPHSREVLPS